MEVIAISMAVIIFLGLIFTKPGQRLLNAFGIKIGNYADNLNTRAEKLQAESREAIDKSQQQLAHNRQLVDKTGTTAADLTGKANHAKSMLSKLQTQLDAAVNTARATKARVTNAEKAVAATMEIDQPNPTPEQSRERQTAQAAHRAALENIVKLKNDMQTWQTKLDNFSQAAAATTQAAEDAQSKVQEAQDTLNVAKGMADSAVAKEQAAEAMRNVDDLSDGGVQETVDRLNEMNAQADAQLDRARGPAGQQELRKMEQEQKLKDLEKDLGL